MNPTEEEIKQATSQIAELVQTAQTAIAEARAIADQYKIDFQFKYADNTDEYFANRQQFESDAIDWYSSRCW